MVLSDTIPFVAGTPKPPPATARHVTCGSPPHRISCSYALSTLLLYPLTSELASHRMRINLRHEATSTAGTMPTYGEPAEAGLASSCIR
jgi:hypothetical protein